MFVFGTRSKQCLSNVHPDMVTICYQALDFQVMDFGVICGHRSEAEQNEAYETGKSKLQWPNSMHNSSPSRAVDLVPWPVDWNDHLAFARLAGIMDGAAAIKGFKIRWGGDWDGDGSSRDQSFMDIGHFELK